jgi:hypothetical protein
MVCPKEYMCISVQVNDHHPSHKRPSLDYGIYTSALGHHNAKSPETVLKMFCEKLGVENPWKKKTRVLI